MNYYSHNLIPNVPSLTFHQLKNTESLITCYPNPSVETLPVLKEVYGINTFVTAINHIDQLYYTKIKMRDWGIDYFNILFLENEKIIIKEKEYLIDKIAFQIKNLFDLIKNEKRTVYISGNGGSFKPSVIAYCILRMSGEQRDDALNILVKLRMERKCHFGDLRFEFAEKKIVPLLIEKELI
jgi:hypothetical protein